MSFWLKVHMRIKCLCENNSTLMLVLSFILTYTALPLFMLRYYFTWEYYFICTHVAFVKGIAALLQMHVQIFMTAWILARHSKRLYLGETHLLPAHFSLCQGLPYYFGYTRMLVLIFLLAPQKLLPSYLILLTPNVTTYTFFIYVILDQSFHTY